jgi:hypothetical protein
MHLSKPQWDRIKVLVLLLLSLSACDANIRPTTSPPKPNIKSKIEPTPPPAPVIKTVGQSLLSSYTGSYALLIGESDYTNGWPDLESIPGELQQVQSLLKSQGFKVEKSLNLNARQLRNRFEKFINQYGFKENNRLLFFYSGHGETRKNKGYLVPTDAPNPEFDEIGFLQKALTMDEILAMARRIEAKHALFLFDSCFSGTVFKAKNLPKIPPQITQVSKLPVRQFITAGSAKEMVPAESVFTPAFVDALRYGWGDLNKDGYVTGQELGMYLWNKVPQHTTRQTPQYGKIRDYELSQGDFVFAVAENKFDLVSPTPGLKDKDRDGVADSQDKCPDNTLAERAKGVYKEGSKIGCPVESDNDGVPDYRDKCPYNQPRELAQGFDSQGCPLDTDQDNVADYRDKCPRNRSKEISAGVNSQGCPLDTDGDGVQDFRDNCSDNTPKEVSKGIDSRGCPLDSDQDGVYDYQDNCPRNTRAELSQGVNAHGCPIGSDDEEEPDSQDDDCHNLTENEDLLFTLPFSIYNYLKDCVVNSKKN